MLKAVIAFVALLIVGMVGLVVHREMSKERGPAPRAVDEDQDVAVISHGDEVEVERHVPSKGLTIVEFSADF